MLNRDAIQIYSHLDSRPLFNTAFPPFYVGTTEQRAGTETIIIHRTLRHLLVFGTLLSAFSF